MARLAQTAGLTDIQQEIISTVRTFVDKEIIPNAQQLEHSDTYPQEIVDGMKEMGLFGLTIAEDYGGLGESLLTYALVVEELSRASPEFEAMWRDNDVRTTYGEAAKQVRHPVAGLIGLEYSAFAVDGRPDLGMVIYNPATPADADRIRTLVKRK